MLIKFNSIQIWKTFLKVFPWIWLLIGDSTKPKDFGFLKKSMRVSRCEDETDYEGEREIEMKSSLPNQIDCFLSTEK